MEWQHLSRVANKSGGKGGKLGKLAKRLPAVPLSSVHRQAATRTHLCLAVRHRQLKRHGAQGTRHIWVGPPIQQHFHQCNVAKRNRNMQGGDLQRATHAHF